MEALSINFRRKRTVEVEEEELTERGMYARLLAVNSGNGRHQSRNADITTSISILAFECLIYVSGSSFPITNEVKLDFGRRNILVVFGF
jgi:hypothetical protein